jgi:S-adenosylhomocysteine hydrolase
MLNAKSPFDPEFLEPDQEIPFHMPILDRWVDECCTGTPLAGVTALFIQHQFGNQLPQTRAMLKLGLEPGRLIWLDVPYSSNAEVREKLVDIGVPRRNLVTARDYLVLEAYAPYQRRRVQALIRDLLDDPPERLLVLDDGAYFLEAASCFKDRLPSVAVVEQTTRGIIKLEKSAALSEYSKTIPVVDVARSIPKSTLEPPFIGYSVCAALLRRLGNQFPSAGNRRCLVLGLGAIGSQVARFTANYLGFDSDHIHVFDPIEERMRGFLEKGFAIWEKEDRSTRFDLVIGCTGQASFGVQDYIYLNDGAILASASSGSVELSREDFIELADSSKIDDIKILRRGLDEENIHSDLRFQMVDREVTFLNGGFPVNFSGRVNCVPTRYMQPTATMMVSAAVQAISCESKGPVKLSPDFSTWIDREFRAELGDDAHRFLEEPQYR